MPLDASFSLIELQSTNSPSDSNSEEDDLIQNAPSLQGDSKLLVYNSCIQELFHSCPSCDAPTSGFKQFCTGTLLTFTTTCLNSHGVKWMSRHQLLVCLQETWTLTAAVLFSGQTYSIMSQFADILKLSFLSESIFHRKKSGMCFQL
jgi:hypothetical protein